MIHRASVDDVRALRLKCAHRNNLKAAPMAGYKLHCFGASGNAYKVALYLNCAGLDWEPAEVDFFNGQTRDVAWRAAINAMGEAPVLEVDGRKLTQSGAILTWLSEMTGTFAPSTPDQRIEALRWMFFDNHKFTSYLATHRFLFSVAPPGTDPAVVAAFKARAEAAYAIVDEHLSAQPFVTGAQPTIADFSMAGYVFYPVEETGIDIAESYPGIDAWRGRMMALDGWKAPYDLMPGRRLPSQVRP
jgi:glutathione S-transferase